MGDRRSTSRKSEMPIVCGYCGSRDVRQIRSAERVLIRCEQCGQRLFAYYTNPERWHEDDTPPTDSDPFLLKQVEADLLRRARPETRHLYQFTRQFILEHGYAPSLREMQSGSGIGSASTIHGMLKELEMLGLIARTPGKARGLRLIHIA